jgi:hypothetical protein
MKRMSRLLWGLMVSWLAVAAAAQPAPADRNQRMDRSAAAREQQAGSARKSAPAAVPRGDLRGDISSNARARNEPPRQENQRQQP